MQGVGWPLIDSCSSDAGVGSGGLSAAWSADLLRSG